MKIVCMPIDENRGLLSPVSSRFCDAASFLLVELDALTWRAIPNAETDGACDPRVLLRGAPVDLFIVADAAGAPAPVPPLDAPVHRAPRGKVADALAALIAGRLPAPISAAPAAAAR